MSTVLDEDAEALRLQELALQTRPKGEHDVLIAQDAGVAKARRVMSQLLAAESVAAAGPASGTSEARYAASPAAAAAAAPPAASATASVG